MSLAPAFRSIDSGAELTARLLCAVRGTTLGDYALAHLLSVYVAAAQEGAAVAKRGDSTATRLPVIAIPPALKALLTELVRYSSLASSSALEVSSRIEKLQLRQCGPLGVKVEMELAAAYFVLRTQA